jgi:hypothetical protein
MMSTDQPRPGEKSVRPKGGKKAKQKRPAAIKPDTKPAMDIVTTAMAAELPAGVEVSTPTIETPAPIPEVRTVLDTPAPLATVSSGTKPVVPMQALTDAYRDCTRHSIENAQLFVEKLSSARSLAAAVQVQTEFAKKAYDDFTADSRRIRELHREMFWQAFTMSGWMAGRTSQARK